VDFHEIFDNARYRIEVSADESGTVITLTDLYSGIVFADSMYRYYAVADDGASILRFDGLSLINIVKVTSESQTDIVITGMLGHGTSSLGLKHTLSAFPDQEYLEETISISNQSNAQLLLRDYRFALAKRLAFDPESKHWDDKIGRFRMIAVPFRIQPDGKKHDYPMEEVYYGRFLTSVSDNPIDCQPRIADQGLGRSEAWGWSDGESGLLISKYNPDMIEYSILDTQSVNGARYLNFGGAAPSLYSEPGKARKLLPGQEMTFGVSRYTFYEGLWRRASYIYRDYMNVLGHGHPDNYNPPVTWCPAVDINRESALPESFHQSYTPDLLRKHADMAQNIGCDMLLLSTGWDTCEGESVWDDTRLGPIEDFVRERQQDFGLRVGIRTVGRAYCNSFPNSYRRNADMSIGYFQPNEARPFYETCTQYPAFIEEKLRRLSILAEAGIEYIILDEFDWRGLCFADNHGHNIPTTVDEHVRSVAGLIKRLHRKHPNVLINTHDFVWPQGVRYLPIYYQHKLPDSFEEIWAFDFARNPLQSLLSGKAISLFYYSMAYEIPLYLYIDMQNDNDNCLAFWWYASTVRHFGISGSKEVDDTRFAAYKKAMSEYLELKDIYTRGNFYGYDETIHVHVLEEEARGVLNAFNLQKEPVSRTVEISLPEIGLPGYALEPEFDYNSARCRVKGAKLIVEMDIPPLSPIIIPLGTKH